MSGSDLYVSHHVWLLNDDMDPLGVVSATSDYGHESQWWSVRFRTDDVPENQWWDYPEIGHASTEHEALDQLRQHYQATQQEVPR